MSDIPIAPGEILREKLKQRGWTQEDLAAVTGKSVKTISDLIRGKSGMSPEFAVALAGAFSNEPENWMRYDAEYKLALIKADLSDIQERSLLFTRAPVREMQKRGWIRQTDSTEALRRELDRFFSAGQMSPVSLRRTAVMPTLNQAESAWCCRARGLARTLLVKQFSPEKISRSRASLRKLAAHPKECRHIAECLADFGVRLVVIEPLSDVKIDGATFWDEFGPVVALSIRYDRIDWFWFTLMHELSHVIHGDPISVDTDLIAIDGVVTLTSSDIEERANREASSSLIATEEVNSFVSRVGPLYSKVRVIQFANRVKIHPGIIVGQLQHMEEIGYSSLREFLVKVRSVITSTTLTDGWGQFISPSISEENTRSL